MLHPTRKRLAKAEVIVKAYARTIPEGDRSWEDLKADLQQDDPIQQSTDKGLMGILVKLRISHAERRRDVLSIVSKLQRVILYLFELMSALAPIHHGRFIWDRRSHLVPTTIVDEGRR